MICPRGGQGSRATDKMGALSRFPLCLPRLSPSQTHFTNPIFFPKISSTTPKPTISIKETVAFGANPGDPKDSIFMDENGVVDDMDAYLNYLSLEYDSVWDTKPSWCQPWTIMLTGASVIACSWLILRSAVVTTLVLSAISLWWYIFLYSYPKAYSDMIADRRKKVRSGVEDTFGVEKSQET